jgi:hypothetical protein
VLTRSRGADASNPHQVLERASAVSRGRRLTTAVVGALLTVGLCPTAAHAGDGAAQLQCEPAPVNQPCTRRPGPVATLGDASQPCPSSAGQSDCGTDDGVPGLDGCRYKLTQPTANTATAIAEGTDEADGVWYVRTCGHGPLGHSTLVRLAVPPAGDLTTLAQHARLTLRLPEPVATVHTGPDLVGWPTWLWLANGSWQPVTTTASAGGQTVTVTATPALAVWQTGDTLAELCPGPGSPWPAGADPTLPSPDCGHLYTEESGRATSPMTVTVLWSVVASETGLRLAPLSTTTTIAVSTAPGGGTAQPEPSR